MNSKPKNESMQPKSIITALMVISTLAVVSPAAFAQVPSTPSTPSYQGNSSYPQPPSPNQPGMTSYPAGQPGQAGNVFQKGQQAINKVQTLIAVFQPYLLKAQQIYGDARALAQNAKNAINGGNGNTYPQSSPYGNGGGQTPYGGQVPASPSQPAPYGGQAPQQPNLPVNNPASVNNDGTGNWGNQNNGLYGNCLDALTGTVMGMGEAMDKPGSVDLLFFAPSDGQNTYTIMTPGFARNNGTATYMTEHTSDQVQQWKEVNETEVALTKLTIGQFNQIQNNNQINGAVRNAQNYAGYYSSVGQKLDGAVLAVKAQMDTREVYALIAVDKQIGTSGSNGYLRIRIKAQGIDPNNNGFPNPNSYIR